MQLARDTVPVMTIRENSVKVIIKVKEKKRLKNGKKQNTRTSFTTKSKTVNNKQQYKTWKNDKYATKYNEL